MPCMQCIIFFRYEQSSRLMCQVSVWSAGNVLRNARAKPSRLVVSSKRFAPQVGLRTIDIWSFYPFVVTQRFVARRILYRPFLQNLPLPSGVVRSSRAATGLVKTTKGAMIFLEKDQKERYVYHSGSRGSIWRNKSLGSVICLMMLESNKFSRYPKRDLLRGYRDSIEPPARYMRFSLSIFTEKTSAWPVLWVFQPREGLPETFFIH